MDSNPALAFSWVTRGKLLNQSVLCFHLQNGNKISFGRKGLADEL